MPYRLSAEDKNMITLEHICKTYRVARRNSGLSAAFASLFHREYETIHALEDISFHIREGEIVGYIGPVSYTHLQYGGDQFPCRDCKGDYGTVEKINCKRGCAVRIHIIFPHNDRRETFRRHHQNLPGRFQRGKKHPHKGQQHKGSSGQQDTISPGPCSTFL